MFLKKLMPFAAVMMCVLCAGCAKEIEVQVSDNGQTTAITTKTEQTVEEALIGAEITLGAKDETEPARDSELTEETTAVTIKRYAKVSVVSGKDTVEVELVGGTVQDAVDQAGIKLAEGQYIKEDPEAFLTDGMTITIVQKLKVTVKADGETKEVYTEAETVQALLDELKITVGDADRVSPDKDEKLSEENAEVIVERVEVKTETKTESIAFTKKTVNSSSMAKGKSKITTQGVNGSKEVTYEVTYVDGKEESRKKISEKILKNPVAQVTTVGTKVISSNSSSSNNQSSGGKIIVSKEKVYDCDGSGHGYYVITYSDGTVVYQDF